MEILPESIPDFPTRSYLTRDDLYGSLDDFFFCVEGKEMFGNVESSILLYHIRDDLPSIFDRDHSFGFFLQSIRRVDIFDFFQGFGIFERFFEFRGEESLLANSFDGGHLRFIEIFFSFLDFDDISYLILIEVTGPFFAISSDKWNRRSFGRESEYRFNLE